VSGETDLVVPSQPGLHLLLDGPETRALPIGPRVAGELLDRGPPVVNVLLDQATPQYRAELERLEVPIEDAEADGRLSYVDAHAATVGWAHTAPATVFAETPDVDAVLLALSEAQAGVVEKAPQHAVVVDNLSSLLVRCGLNEAYRFGQSIASMAPRMGAIAVARLIPGMHDERSTTAMRHLATTVTDVSRTSTPDTSTQRTADDGFRHRDPSP
jgi:hypothetical protein